jgi:hypothetical protein
MKNVHTTPKLTTKKSSLWSRFIKWLTYDFLEEQAEYMRSDISKSIKKKANVLQREIEKVLVVSTVHIRLETDSRFSQFAFVPGDVPGISDLPFTISAVEWGYILKISLDPEYKIDKEDMKAVDLEDVYDILEMAYQAGCAYIHISADGPEYDDLKSYKW